MTEYHGAEHPTPNDGLDELSSESMSIIEMINNSLVGESHDMVSLGKARSMILADNALVESPFTDRDIFNIVNNT